MEETHVVTTESVLRRGHFFRKFWVAGWIFGMACLGIACYMAGLEHGHRESVDDVINMTSELRDVITLQDKTTAAFVTAWEDQNEKFDMVTSWAEYVHDRADLANANEGVVIPRPHRLVKK